MTVRVYTTPNCNQCAMTKMWLDKKGVHYSAVDLADPANMGDYEAIRALRNEQAAAYREANRELLAKKARERYAARREQVRESAKWSSLKSEYGLTRAQYEALVESQGGRCALCGRGGVKRLYVDHCHVENRIRGALCPGCNTGLGLLGDNLDGLRAAMAYLSTVPDRINPILPNGPACSGGFRRTSNPESEAA